MWGARHNTKTWRWQTSPTVAAESDVDGRKETTQDERRLTSGPRVAASERAGPGCQRAKAWREEGERGLHRVKPAHWAEGEEESDDAVLGCLLGHYDWAAGAKAAKREGKEASSARSKGGRGKGKVFLFPFLFCSQNQIQL